MSLEGSLYVLLNSLKQGDMVKLTNGSTMEFLRKKQTKFVAMKDGKSYDVPVSMFAGLVSRATVTEKASVQLTPGELFYYSNNKGTAALLIFDHITSQGNIVGINPIGNIPTTIQATMFAGTVKDLMAK